MDKLNLCKQTLLSMKVRDLVFALLVASAVNVSESELTDAFNVFVEDLKAEQEGVK